MKVVKGGKVIEARPYCGNDSYTVATRVSGYIYSTQINQASAIVRIAKSTLEPMKSKY